MVTWRGTFFWQIWYQS